MEDVSCDESDGVCNDGTSFMDVGRQTGNAERAMVKWLITSIPPNVTIKSATFKVSLISEFLDSAETADVNVHHAFDQNWMESTLTWATQPCGANFNDSGLCNLIADDMLTYINNVGVGEYKNYDVTSSLTTAYNDGDENYTLVLKGFEDNVDTDSLRHSTTDDANTLTHPILEIIYSGSVDVNAIAPKDIDLNFTNTNDGNFLIDFNALSGDTNYVFADLYYSTTQLGFDNSIIQDLNLLQGALNPTSDFNCSSSDFNNNNLFSACTFDFNFAILANADYFIDVNLHTANGNFEQDSTDTTFTTSFVVVPLVTTIFDTFEVVDMNWTQDATDDCDWTRDSGGTGSGNTGPSAGANGSTWFMYIETSVNFCETENDAARLLSPTLDLTNRDGNFSMAYHMYGATINDLNVEINTGSGWESIFYISGAQLQDELDDYNSMFVDISDINTTVDFRITARRGGTFTGDIAIDDINIVSSPKAAAAPDTTCDDNVVDQDWIISDECYFKDTTINLGSGTLYITSTGVLGLDNSILLARDFASCENSGTARWCIKTANGGKVLTNQ